jgi:hypothetical protein
MGVLHAAEIKRQDRHSADTGMECSTIVGVLAGATSTCVILRMFAEHVSIMSMKVGEPSNMKLY